MSTARGRLAGALLHDHRMDHGLLDDLASVDIVSGPLPYGLLLLAGALTGVLVTQVGLRRRQSGRRRAVGVTVALVVGAGVGALVSWLVTRVWNPFGIPVPALVGAYVVVLGAVVSVAVLSVHRARWWRTVLAGGAVLVFALTATLAGSAAFGLDPTLGSLAGRAPVEPSERASVQPVPATAGTVDLAARWRPPRHMPTHGRLRSVDIPALHSGFHARPAGLYLPPAALVRDAPRLPLMIMMMGQPGNPDPQYVGRVLDRFAARNHGLAPIVVVADQLGSPDQDPGCTDSRRFGDVETYVTVDVLDWARQHLDVDPSGATTTIGGYSNGGACAMLYAAKYPSDFRNVLDVSGEVYPGSEDPSAMLASVFHGDQTAYEAQQPATVLARHRYPDGVVVCTAGSDDPVYVAATRQTCHDAAAAGFTTRVAEIPHGGHVLGALLGGLRIDFQALYPRLGLSVRR